MGYKLNWFGKIIDGKTPKIFNEFSYFDKTEKTEKLIDRLLVLNEYITAPNYRGELWSVPKEQYDKACAEALSIFHELGVDIELPEQFGYFITYVYFENNEELLCRLSK